MSTTINEEYYKKLSQIQSNNATVVASLNWDENTDIYEINLETREIETPNTIIIESDHMADTIYFKCARYFDNIDMTNTICLVQFINAKKEQFTYVVPYYDVTTYKETQEMIIPWILSGNIGSYIGKTQFSFRFFKMDNSQTELIYNLNTLSSTLTVQAGIGFNPEDIIVLSSEKYEMVATNDTEFNADKEYYKEVQTVEEYTENGETKKRLIISYEKIDPSSVSLDDGTVYYEKLNTLGKLEADYYAFLTNAAKAASEGGIYWEVLS